MIFTTYKLYNTVKDRGDKMIIHTYKTPSGKDLILDYINSLSEKEQIDGFSVLENIENDELDKVLIKTWEKKIKEVYFYKHNRIFFVIVDGINVYLLHACRKQKNKTEKIDGKIVKKRAKELGHMLGKTFV